MTEGQWYKLSLAEQVGNIGAELSRAKKDRTAFSRVLELIDLTLKRHPLKELARLREVVCDIMLGSRFYNVSLLKLESFYLPFAILARRQKIQERRRERSI